MGSDPLAVDGHRGFPPPGSTEDGGYGPRTPMGWDMGVSTHWGGYGDGGTRLDWGI